MGRARIAAPQHLTERIHPSARHLLQCPENHYFRVQRTFAFTYFWFAMVNKGWFILHRSHCIRLAIVHTQSSWGTPDEAALV